MTTAKKIAAYSDRILKTAAREAEELARSVADHLSLPGYNRAMHLRGLINLRHDFETQNPELNNPTKDDLAISVHIIALLEGAITYENSKVLSGTSDYDFIKRVRLVYALRNESGILAAQVDAMEQIANAAKAAEQQETKKNDRKTL